MILLDTNILARVIQKGHPHHRPALEAIVELRLRMREVPVIAPQVIVEFYAICTRPQNGLGLTADQTIAEIAQIKRENPLLPESPSIFENWELLIQKYKVTNRHVYDLRFVAFMLTHNIPRILSFNDVDFAQFSEIQVMNPFDILNIPRV